ncbi:unnamed protein product [Peniophora sp. CBMAI 1063]|nr:unnamed protein product [Peniophora sp. CBMAI 1063]
MPAPAPHTKTTASPAKPIPMPRRATDAGIGAVPPRPTVAAKAASVRGLLHAHKRADSAANPRDITLSQTKPTVKRANTLDKLRPSTWSKSSKVAAPAPLSSDEAEEIDILIPSNLLRDDHEDDPVGLSTGTFHGLSAKKLLPTLGKNKRRLSERPALLVRVDTELSYSSSSADDSSGESSEATCVGSLSPSPDLSLSSRSNFVKKPSPTQPPLTVQSPSTPSPAFGNLPKDLHHDTPPAHQAIVQPVPLRPNVLKAAEILQHGEDWEAQVLPVSPPSRPSSAPSLFGGSLEPIQDAEEDAYYEERYHLAFDTQLKWHRAYDEHLRILADVRLRDGLDIQDCMYLRMTEEQRAQVHAGPWKFVDMGKEGKWVVDRKKWEKRARKLQKEEAKAALQTQALQAQYDELY